MPQTKFQDFIFTLIMASLMVYGMIVYNIALDMGQLTNQVFRLALAELPIMVPIAVILEMFVVSPIAAKLAFRVVRPTDRPAVITLAISFVIVCIMCPIMSLIATGLFQSLSFASWVQTLACNLPAAMLWQMCYCGPFSRLVFRTLFRRQLTQGAEKAHAPAAMPEQA